MDRTLRLLLWSALLFGCTEHKSDAGALDAAFDAEHDALADGAADASMNEDASDDDAGGGAVCELVGETCPTGLPQCCPIYGERLLFDEVRGCVDYTRVTSTIGCGPVCGGSNLMPGCYDVPSVNGVRQFFFTTGTWSVGLLRSGATECEDDRYLTLSQCP